jgi:hypothetical protein
MGGRNPAIRLRMPRNSHRHRRPDDRYSATPRALRGESSSRSRAHSCSGRRAVYGKLTNRSLKSVAFAASPNIGITPKIASIVRSVELWV